MLTPENTIAIVNIVVTVFLGVIGWIVAWRIAKSPDREAGRGGHPIRIRRAYLLLAIIIGVSILGLLFALYYPPKTCITHKDVLLAILHAANLTWSLLATVLIRALEHRSEHSEPIPISD